MKKAMPVGMLALLLSSCAEQPLGEAAVESYSLSLLQGGSGGVYFLPPLLQAMYEGPFDAGRSPVVVICADTPATPCSSAVAVFDMIRDAGETGAEVLKVNRSEEQYHVNWKPRDAAAGAYRIFVVEGGVTLAHVDVAFVGGGRGGARGLRIHGAEDVRSFNGTLPIKFRITPSDPAPEAEPQPVPEPEPEPEPEPPSPYGLTASYFDWRQTPLDFAQAVPVLQRVDRTIDFLDTSGTGDVFRIGQNDHILARWTGFIVPEANTSYRFCVTADDGVRMWINGVVFIDRWVDQDDTDSCSAYWFLSAGYRYSIRLEWYHATGGAAVRLQWQTQNQASLSLVPSTALWPN